jgi:3',5'-nucleoside bisphosphate phosphatase
MIDLHSHTTASDGELEPAALIDLAAQKGITTLAVTDHDTVAAAGACAERAKHHGLRFVPGIEVSIRYLGREVHILGHFVDPAEPQLASFEKKLKSERHKRMAQMVERVQKLGFPISLQEVEAMAQNAHLARPHLARVLLERNYVSSTKEAFDRFLGDGKAADVGRFEVTLIQALALIHCAGGTATVAHPGVSRLERLHLAEMAQAGLDGVEVEHSDHPPSKREQLHQWANELNLVATAGTDFHGPTVAPNRHFGHVSMTEERFAKLESRRP